MYGYGESEAKEMNIRELVPEGEKGKTLDLIGEVRSEEPVESVETTRLTKDGRTLDIRLTLTTLTDESGSVYAVATTERDISDFKEKEKEYKKEIYRLKTELKEAREEEG